MSSQINDLIKMRDIDTLFELMTEEDNWMTQLEAAEGLVKLGDRRGYEFLLKAATQSDDEDMQQVAREILDTQRGSRAATPPGRPRSPSSTSLASISRSS